MLNLSNRINMSKLESTANVAKQQQIDQGVEQSEEIDSMKVPVS